MSKTKNIENEEIIAKANHVRVSPDKLRRVANVVRSKMAVQAMAILKQLPHKGAHALYKVIKSACANASHNNKVDPDTLVVSKLLVNEGLRFSRFRARARGRVFPVQRRTSKIVVGLSKKPGGNS